MLRKLFFTHIAIFLVLFVKTNCYASYPDTLIHTVNVGAAPTSVVSANGYLFVANSSESSVTVIDLSTFTVENTVDIGYSPHHLIASSDGTKVYASAFSDDNIVVISTSTHTIIKTLTEVCDGPSAMCLSPAGDKLYVACKEADKVSVISTSSDKKLNDINEVGDAPVYPVTTLSGDFLYVTLEAESMIVKVDLAKNEVTSTKIAVGTEPQGIALTPGGNFLFVANQKSDSVSKVSLSSDRVVETIGSAGDGTREIAILNNGEHALITNSSSDNVTVLNILDNTISDTITVGSSPNGISASDDGRYAYVTDKGSNTVSILEDLTKILIDLVSKRYLSSASTSRITWHTTESGTYQVEVGGSGTKGSGDYVISGTVTANQTFDTDIQAATHLTGVDGAYKVYIYLTVTGGTEYSNYATLILDTVAPAAPTGVTTRFGDTRVNLSWDETFESDIDGFRIYYGTAPGVYTDSVDIDVSTSYTLTGLTNSTTYYIAISALDLAGNESSLSAEVSETPDKILSLSELNGENNCFIAETSFKESENSGFLNIINYIKNIIDMAGN